MSVYALHLANAADTAARVRAGHLLDLPVGGSPVTSFSGLRRDGGGEVAVVTGSMTVTVSPFVAWAQSATAAQGGYPVVCDAQVTLAIGAGHPSQTRVDTVAAVVRDDAFDGSGFTDARVVVVAGTPGLGAPALPPTCVPLRNVIVPAGTSAGGGGLASTNNLGDDRRAYLTSDLSPAPVNLSDGWTGQLNYVRRAGIVVIDVVISRAAFNPGDGIYTMPDGFRPPFTVRTVGSYGDELRPFAIDPSGLLRVDGSRTYGSGIFGSITYPAVT